MGNNTKFYIDGAWVDPQTPHLFDVINPATEEVAGQISLGSSADVDRAVAAARRAFTTYSQTSRDERLALLQRIIDGFEARNGELARAMTSEMGSPITFSNEVQTVNALTHFKEMISVLKSYEFERFMGGTLIRREPIGVCGLITPWNWPLNQVTSKLAPAIAAGCTAVLKPSEIAPLSAILFAEILHDAGVPKGVFNLVNGDGPTVGEAISNQSTWSPSPAQPAPEYWSPRERQRPSSAWCRSLAESPPTSCCQMPIWKRPFRPGSCAASPIRVSPARPRPACWFIARSAMPPLLWRGKPPIRSRMAIHSTLKRPWDRWSAKLNSTKCKD